MSRSAADETIVRSATDRFGGRLQAVGQRAIAAVGAMLDLSRATLLSQAGATAAHSACKRHHYRMGRELRTNKVSGAPV